MKVGTFMMPLHPPEKDRTQTFEEDVECVIWADELGFSEAWIGQHHTAGWEPIPSNDVFIAHMLPQTTNIRLGTGVTIITQHHPANVAVRLAYLDHLAKGRLNVGFGQGGVPTDWALFDLPDPRTQGLMTLEAMDIVLKLWQEEGPFEFKGDYWNIKLDEKVPELGLGQVLQPYQKPHPPIAMSIVREESMAATTGGQRGFIPISINMAPPHKVKAAVGTLFPRCPRSRTRTRPLGVAHLPQHIRRRDRCGGAGTCVERCIRCLACLPARNAYTCPDAGPVERRSRYARRGN